MKPITAIVIPCDDEQEMRAEQLNPTDLDTFQRLVGGLVEVVMFDRPPASLYCHDEAKLVDAPINKRATALAWAHNDGMRGRDTINGDAFLVGVPNARGVDRTVPQEYIDLLLSTYHFRVEVLCTGETRWAGNQQLFPDPIAAYVYGAQLAERWLLVEHYRVVPVKGDVKD